MQLVTEETWLIGLYRDGLHNAAMFRQTGVVRFAWIDGMKNEISESDLVKVVTRKVE